MGLYNFKPQFVPLVEDWSKLHTIRAYRQNNDTPGQVMHLYTGLRHPGARCLMRVPCMRAENIYIEGGPNRTHRIEMGYSYGFDELPPMYGTPTGGPRIVLAEDELNALAWRDGFRPEGSTLETPGDSFTLMMGFWDGRLPFEGLVLHWNPAKQRVKNQYGIWKWQAVEHAKGTAV